jgi:hypothetical protein
MSDLFIHFVYGFIRGMMTKEDKDLRAGLLELEEIIKGYIDKEKGK